MLELELVQFRQPLRAGEIRGLAFFLKLQFLAERINKVQMCGTGPLLFRQTWQHPCGLYRDVAAIFEPRKKYGSYFAADVKPA